MPTQIQQFFTIILLVSSIILLNPRAYAAEDSIGQVIWVQGKVTAVQGEQTRALQRRDPLYLHDKIVTDKDSSGEVTLTDSTLITLKADTEFSLDNYHYQKNEKPGEGRSVMSLLKGGFRTITGAVPKESPENYQVNTPVATIGVRGTDYTAIYYADRGLVLTIDFGKIVVRNNLGLIELNKELDQIYATVPVHGAPILLKNPPSTLTPIIMPVIPNNSRENNTTPPPLNGGGGNHPDGGQGIDGSHPGNGSNPLSPHGGYENGNRGFCISFLKKICNKWNETFG